MNFSKYYIHLSMRIIAIKKGKDYVRYGSGLRLRWRKFYVIFLYCWSECDMLSKTDRMIREHFVHLVLGLQYFVIIKMRKRLGPEIFKLIFL